MKMDTPLNILSKDKFTRGWYGNITQSPSDIFGDEDPFIGRKSDIHPSQGDSGPSPCGVGVPIEEIGRVEVRTVGSTG
jgi:hypothetical protein